MLPLAKGPPADLLFQKIVDRGWKVMPANSMEPIDWDLMLTTLVYLKNYLSCIATKTIIRELVSTQYQIPKQNYSNGILHGMIFSFNSNQLLHFRESQQWTLRTRVLARYVLQYKHWKISFCKVTRFGGRFQFLSSSTACYGMEIHEINLQFGIVYDMPSFTYVRYSNEN